MKKLLIPAVAIVAIALASCNKPAPTVVESAQAPIDSVGQKNKELVRAYFDVVTSGKTDQIASYLADDFKGYGPSRTDSTNREKTVAEWTKNWKDDFSSVKYTEDQELAVTIKDGQNAGDWVLKWGTVAVEYKNGLKSVKFNLHLAIKVVNGKIAFAVEFYNVADILTQQGFTFVPPKGAKK